MARALTSDERRDAHTALPLRYEYVAHGGGWTSELCASPSGDGDPSPCRAALWGYAETPGFRVIVRWSE